jgi:hypothetical protein
MELLLAAVSLLLIFGLFYFLVLFARLAIRVKAALGILAEIRDRLPEREPGPPTL